MVTNVSQMLTLLSPCGFRLHSWFLPLQQGNTRDQKTKKKSERVIAGSVSGKKTKPGETGRGRNGGNRPELIHAERGEH